MLKLLIVQACSIRLRIETYASILGWAEVDLFIALRISAVWGYSRSLFVIVFILGVTPVITNSMSASITLPAYSPDVSGCFVTLTRSISDFKRKYAMCAYLTRSMLILQDVVVLAATWIKTSQQFRIARRSNLAISLSMCLLRDGTAYFVVLLILNATQMAIFASEGEQLSALLSVMPLILTNRFMMNLRKLGSRINEDTEAQQWSQFSSVAFNPATTALVGNIGECLDLSNDSSDGFGHREWYELDEVESSSDDSTLEIGFSSTGAVYEGASAA
ncbi:uncharacterized protein PHACADRAFT_251491 [Phanerochaete carnosa HHB-10118-sp]|uniref:Uncharacterized protein n=1 Tax=Phanerochaete carnosa (strain HHB-10118-sp) TaxID=650164 RepID=K5WF42_PHACS|nr:uncharacterized protein PHACADRAFT_251491 [Phanerochaete carnosa HHB-10118-sp]EKM57699.1 hypothetical protein PHACADRAFT_251491 [Phanerochaete carnosa HHB-10118-sp]